ncbi:hypothetical protein Y032_0222g2613 [Ancylostoma ceylanicum]|uniref:Uncharacterized protein n=1 Tax=Ancylostoma ceylanicum TaxID=53326 RepID=A0A016SHN4_9BILA|nr:hypothetical protein Y032_0222g2613 [Ancylostoma ceylanicum]
MSFPSRKTPKFGEVSNARISAGAAFKMNVSREHVPPFQLSMIRVGRSVALFVCTVRFWYRLNLAMLDKQEFSLSPISQ